MIVKPLSSTRFRAPAWAAALLLVAPAVSVGPAASVSDDRRDTWTLEHPGEPGKECPQPVWPAADGQAPSPGFGRRVVIVGDSLTKYAHSPLTARLTRKGWLPTIICWGGTQTNWGTRQLRDLAARHTLPDRVVVAFGTNDVHKNPCSGAADCRRYANRYAARARALLEYLGPQRTVWWLNIDLDPVLAERTLGEPWNVHFPAFNRKLARVVRDYPNVRLIDWAGIVAAAEAKRPIPRTADGLHYAPIERPRQSAGTMLRVRTITAALAGSA